MTIDPYCQPITFVVTDPAMLGAYYYPARKFLQIEATKRARLAEAQTVEREADLDRRVAEMTAEREAETARLRQRHADLLVAYAGHPVLSALLDEHAPCEGRNDLECHGCPENHDTDYGCEYMEWPCPTWTTIANGAAQ